MMEDYTLFPSPLLLLLLLLGLLLSLFNPTTVMCGNPAIVDASGADELRTYIISVQPPEGDGLTASTEELESWYRSFLPETTAGSAESQMVFTYGEVFSGFAARLTAEEVESMKKKRGFVRAYPDRHLPLLTTRTPDFLGLQLGTGLWNASSLGSGVIIGMLDSGVRLGHPSFDDDGVPPPPDKWKGSCDFPTGCNNKIIGGKLLTGDLFDEDGHGTLLASTAAGNFVKGASLFGLANGTAAGIAPRAHLAIYKVCLPADGYCKISNVLAGIDAAVKDGVDVITTPIGGWPMDFQWDPIAIGALSATEKGIIFVAAAGNFGPDPSAVVHEAPWILTVGASAIDRSLRSTVTLGDGREFHGETLYQPHNTPSTKFPLYFPDSGDCTNFSSGAGVDVKGKLVVCNYKRPAGYTTTHLGSIVKDAGGAGMVLFSSELAGYTMYANVYDLPASNVADPDGSKIASYANSTKEPTASITFDGTVLGVSPAPVIAFFSSRGPGVLAPGILKPDVTGPGMNILAAWPVDPVAAGGKKGTGKYFNINSGTFISASHLSGVAALVKSVHPGWSPAAIKSAIMTTSDAAYRDGRPILDERHLNASFFAMGAGHVNPARAADPGLVYDLDATDYAAYLCGRGYGNAGVGMILRRTKVNCSEIGFISEAELNYPSLLVTPGAGTVTVNRTVTNVGAAKSTYRLEVEVPKGAVSVSVVPEELTFSEVNQKKRFAVSVRWSGRAEGVVEGNLRWVSKDHIVRSPIIISTHAV